MKPEIVAAALSALMPGTGQLYNHQWLKGGVLILAVMIVSGVIRRRGLIEASGAMSIMVTLALFGLALFAVADAYLGAKKAS